MHGFRYLMPSDTIERITRQKLCDDLGNVLGGLGADRRKELTFQ